jgi:predicted ATPase
MAQVDVVRATATPGGLLERADELSALDDRLDAVEESGCGHVVLLRGEAGVGKTALIREFCERRRGSVTIAGGACEPLFAPRPRGRFLEIAQTLKGDLLPLVEQGAMPYQVVVALAEELRRQAPTVLLLEDVHWADEATLDVLRLLARRIESVPALVVASYRDDELDVRDPLRIVIGELATSPSISRMKLSGLSPGAVAVSTPTCGSRWMSPSSATKSSAPLVRACSACATDTSDPARSPSRPCSYASRVEHAPRLRARSLPPTSFPPKPGS